MSVGKKVRRLGVFVAAVAVMGVIAAPAQAKSDPDFAVIGERISDRPLSGGGFVVRDALFNPHNLSNRVGNAKVVCRDRGKLRCIGRFHFDGSIGGFGDLWVKGNFGAGGGGDRDTTLNIVDGTGTFGGDVTGKMDIDPVTRRTTVYRFHITD